jgi:hypothetical protein
MTWPSKARAVALRGGMRSWAAAMKSFAEDVVDVGGGEEIPVEGGGDFGAEALGLEDLKFLFGVEGAEGCVGRDA